MPGEKYFRLHPDLVVRSSIIHGSGTFATSDLKRGTLLLIIGGLLVTVQEEAERPERLRDAGVQIESDLVLSPPSREAMGGISNINHSCDPNAGFRGQILLVAIRDIAKGEEVTFDYAMCLGDGPSAPPYRVQCHCGVTGCRGWITDKDWTIPDLQARYRGFFQPYLQARMEQSALDSRSRRLAVSKTSTCGLSNPKHDTEFLKQVPDWEDDYKRSDELQIHYSPEQWKSAEAEFSEHDLRILGEPVMEDWEEPYMRVLADIATRNGGVVLEVGFGMGISARFIQQARIERHIIIEANHAVARKAREWAKTCRTETAVLEGLWQEAILSLPDDSLDGILFDTYPLSEKEIYQNHFTFFPTAFAKLKKGGFLTYYSDETQWFSDIHIQRLTMAGFAAQEIDGTVVSVTPPHACEYWRSNTILAPIVRK